MAEYNVATTGQSPTVFNQEFELTWTHPESKNLLGSPNNFGYSEILDNTTLQELVDGGDLEITDENGTSIASLNPAVISQTAVTKVISCYDSTGGMNVDNVEVEVVMTDDAVIDDAYTRSGGEITVLEDGLYELSGWATVITINSTAGTRGAPRLTMQRNGTNVPGMLAQGYIRENGPGLLGTYVSVQQLLALTANDVIRIVLDDQVTSEPNQQTLGDGSGMIIKKVREL